MDKESQLKKGQNKQKKKKGKENCQKAKATPRASKNYKSYSCLPMNNEQGNL